MLGVVEGGILDISTYSYMSGVEITGSERLFGHSKFEMGSNNLFLGKLEIHANIRQEDMQTN